MEDVEKNELYLSGLFFKTLRESLKKNIPYVGMHMTFAAPFRYASAIIRV